MSILSDIKNEFVFRFGNFRPRERWRALQETWQPGYSRSYRLYRLREALGYLTDEKPAEWQPRDTTKFAYKVSSGEAEYPIVFKDGKVLLKKSLTDLGDKS